jgi:hypothetical protein
MDEQPTCGKGLAEHSVLPAKLGALTAAVADVLAAHQEALDLTDANAKREYDAYAELVDAHRLTAAQLEAIARRMASYRDLPMGRHDMSVMTAAPSRDTFARLVAMEDELLELLGRRVAEHRAMLGEMQSASAAS